VAGEGHRRAVQRVEMWFLAALMMVKPNQESSANPIALMAPHHVCTRRLIGFRAVLLPSSSCCFAALGPLLDGAKGNRRCFDAMHFVSAAQHDRAGVV
jgi:hypothetical protein